MKRLYPIRALALITGMLLGGAELSLMPEIPEPPATRQAMTYDLPAVSAIEPRTVPQAYISPPAPKYSESDAELIACVLYSECRGEPREGQLMVSQCLIDRREPAEWGDSIESVIHWPNQFAKPGELTDELYGVAVATLMGERFSEDTILYFRKDGCSASAATLDGYRLSVE